MSLQKALDDWKENGRVASRLEKVSICNLKEVLEVHVGDLLAVQRSGRRTDKPGRISIGILEKVEDRSIMLRNDLDLAEGQGECRFWDRIDYSEIKHISWLLDRKKIDDGLRSKGFDVPDPEETTAESQKG